MMHDKELSGCAGKTPYQSKGDALVVIRRREKKGRVKQRGRGKMGAYLCRFCKAWHVGSASS